MTNEELTEVLRLHGLWLRREDGGKRADLSWENLSWADLRKADLRRADLRGADLSRADLRRADLRGADLSGAYLSGAYLSGAYLSGADLSEADLSGADLGWAHLGGIKIARCDWTDHGESGRTLVAMYLPARAADGDRPAQEATVEYRCGCFVGTESELHQYIADGEQRFRKSRTIAADFCAARIAEMTDTE